MTREEALAALSSPSTSTRIEAARFLLLNPDAENLQQLQARWSVETDAYVKQRLEQAIRRVAFPIGGDADADLDRERSIAFGDESHDATHLAKATEWVGGLLLHEMEGHIGRIGFYASREITDYQASRTRLEVEKLKNVFRGIDQLVTASKTPRPEAFDLAALIDGVVDEFDGAPVSAVGQRPFLVTADSALLRLAVCNGIKNAVEAVGEIQDQTPHAVVVSWGQTDRDIWVTVMDHGPGVDGSVQSKFALGASSKDGHSGFGLAVAKRVMDAMGGTVELVSQRGAGARYELRWVK